MGVATELIAHAPQRFPDDGTVLTEAARVASSRQRFDEAIFHLEKAIAICDPLQNLTIARDYAKASAEASRPQGPMLERSASVFVASDRESL